MEAARHHTLVLKFSASLPKLGMNMLILTNLPDLSGFSLLRVSVEYSWVKYGVERVMGFCIFLVGSQIDERSSSSGGEFEGMGTVGPGLPQAAA